MKGWYDCYLSRNEFQTEPWNLNESSDEAHIEHLIGAKLADETQNYPDRQLKAPPPYSGCWHDLDPDNNYFVHAQQLTDW